VDWAFHCIEENFCGEQTFSRLKREFVDPLTVEKHVSNARSPTVPRGVLFWGPPGTAKTTLATKFTFDCGFRVLWCGTAAEINRPYVGQAEQAIQVRIAPLLVLALLLFLLSLSLSATHSLLCLVMPARTWGRWLRLNRTALRFW
jgi:hypothetical protein